MVDWSKAEKKDFPIINKIAIRAAKILGGDMFDWAMSVSAGHIACPVDLEGLYAAREFDFVHDVAGINKNLNHLTGNLDNSFIPRYAIKNRKGGRLGKQYHYQCLSNR